MVTTITLNTSVDKLYLVETLEDYTVMRVKSVRNTAGGKGLNVARVTNLLGEDVTALGFAGGFNGDYVIHLLEEQGIKSNFTPIAAETRSCINIRELSSGRHTEFLEPGAPVSEAECMAFLEQFRSALEKADVVTISGSLPAGIPADFYAKLVSITKQAGKAIIVDTSGPSLIETLKAKPTMIKPNTDEMQQLFGKKISSFQEVIAAAKELHQSGIDYVVVSLGKDGAILACKDGVFQGITPDLPVVNTVGCGDSMVAGFAVGLSQKKSAEEMLHLAMAVSTANAMNIETGYYETEDFQAIYPQIQIKKLS